MCAWIPANLGEDEGRQKRTKEEIEDAFDGEVTVSEDRPKGILGNAALAEFSALLNAFCPTGPGGGVNPHCSPGTAATGAGGFPVGHKFTKTYNGQTYEVEVLASGYQVTDPSGIKSTYGSLTSAAQGVRGNTTSINGWAFFNQTRPSAATPATPPAQASPMPAAPVPKALGPNGLTVGDTYTKTYQGQDHKLEITANGFQITDPLGSVKTYSSLSAAAMGVKDNNVATNGWAFFGIDRPTTASPPIASTPATPSQSGPNVSTPQPAGPTVPYQKETNWQTGSPQPGVLNGIPFASAPPKFWEKTKDVDIKEPKPLSKIDRVGVMIKESDGRIWIVQPTNNFGDRKYTMPGGGVEKGLTDQQNALKEVWEETGLHVKITGHVGDFIDSNNGNNGRLYFGERIGGAPWDAKVESHIISTKTGKPAAESETVSLVTPDHAAQLLHRTDDLAQLASVNPISVGTKTDSNVIKKIVEAVKPAATAYDNSQKSAGLKTGNPILHAVQDWRGFNDKPTVVSKSDMDKLIAKGDHIEMLRGVTGHGSLTSKDLADAFRTGDNFPGHGVFGSGTYADATKGTGNMATHSYGRGGDLIRMALPKDAKIIEESELERKVPSNPSGFSGYANGNGSSAECWMGVQAALAGYDAIHVDGKSSRHGSYGNSMRLVDGGFYVILNRGILTVQGTNAKGHVIK